MKRKWKSVRRVQCYCFVINHQVAFTTQHIQIINSTSISTLCIALRASSSIHLHIYICPSKGNIHSIQLILQSASLNVNFIPKVCFYFSFINDIAFYLLSHTISLPFNAYTHTHLHTSSPPHFLPAQLWHQRRKRKKACLH